MRVEDEEIYWRSPKQPMMIRVGGAEVDGTKVVRVTVNIFPREGQTTGDLDLATASIIHGQELFTVLEAIVDEIKSIGGPGDAINHDLFECAELMVRDVKDYW